MEMNSFPLLQAGARSRRESRAGGEHSAQGLFGGGGTALPPLAPPATRGLTNGVTGKEPGALFCPRPPSCVK